MQVIIVRCESYLHLGVKQTKECLGETVCQCEGIDSSRQSNSLKKFDKEMREMEEMEEGEEEGSCSNFKHNEITGNGGGKKNTSMHVD